MAEDIAARLKDGSGEDRDVDDLLAKLWFFYKARHSRGKPEETMPFGKQGGAWHLVGVLLDAIKTIDRLTAPPMTAKSISELVERLRHPQCVDANCVKCKAAGALESQAAEIARLRESQDFIATAYVLRRADGVWDIRELHSKPEDAQRRATLTDTVIKVRLVRAALAETPAGPGRQGPRTDAG